MRKLYKELTYVNFQDGGFLLWGSADNKSIKPDYKKLLNKRDPIDKIILELAKKGTLSVGVVWVKENLEDYPEGYSYKEPIENIWKKKFII